MFSNRSFTYKYMSLRNVLLILLSVPKLIDCFEWQKSSMETMYLIFHKKPPKNPEGDYKL